MGRRSIKIFKLTNSPPFLIFQQLQLRAVSSPSLTLENKQQSSDNGPTNDPDSSSHPAEVNNATVVEVLHCNGDIYETARRDQTHHSQTGEEAAHHSGQGKRVEQSFIWRNSH